MTTSYDINTTLLSDGFVEAPQKILKNVAEGFALIEANNLGVAEFLLHPSLVHRFVLPTHHLMDVDETYETVGTLWGVRVKLDTDAPHNGFTLKSKGEIICIRFEGPELPSRESTEIPVVLCKRPVRPENLAELMDLRGSWGGAGSLRLDLTARSYADIRMFGRDILDIESRVSELKKGIQGTLWGVPLVTSYTAHATQFVLQDNDRVYAILETDPEANPALKERTDKILSGEPPKEYIDRLLSGLEKGVNEVWAELLYELDDPRAEEAKNVLLRAVSDRLVEKYGTNPA